MTIFVISKDPSHERLISWPLQANVLAPTPPKPEFSKPRHFSYIRSAAGLWSGFWLDAANMFHNLPVPPATRDLFPMQVVDYDDCSEPIQAHLRLRFPQYAAPGFPFRPMHARPPWVSPGPLFCRTHA